MHIRVLKYFGLNAAYDGSIGSISACVFLCREGNNAELSSAALPVPQSSLYEGV